MADILVRPMDRLKHVSDDLEAGMAFVLMEAVFSTRASGSEISILIREQGSHPIGVEIHPV